MAMKAMKKAKVREELGECISARLEWLWDCGTDAETKDKEPTLQSSFQVEGRAGLFRFCFQGHLRCNYSHHRAQDSFGLQSVLNYVEITLLETTLPCVHFINFLFFLLY